MVDVRELIECASDAAFAVKEDRCVLAWNKAARDLLGYSEREVVGRKCHEVIRAVFPNGEPLCGPSCAGGRCFERRQPFNVKSCLALHRDGRRVALELLSNMVVPRTGKGARGGASAAIVFLRPKQDTLRTRPLDQPPRIYTLGHFGLVLNGSRVAVEGWARKQSLTLLKYLVAHRGTTIHRERLMDCLWPEVSEDRARQRLKVTVYFLRQQVRAAGMEGVFIESSGDGYLLRCEAVWVDADAFERLATVGIELERGQKWPEALRCYEDALVIYRGDYLEEDTYADWCAEERERLREIYFEMLERMTQLYITLGRHAEAAQMCHTALVREPCRERFHHTLMTCLAELGRPDQALIQFRRCRQILAQELDVEPLPETYRLYRQILKDRSIARKFAPKRA